jgi:hypothetical protein
MKTFAFSVTTFYTTMARSASELKSKLLIFTLKEFSKTSTTIVRRLKAFCVVRGDSPMRLPFNPRPNKSLDRSADGLFLNLFGSATLNVIAAPGQLHRYAASSSLVNTLSFHRESTGGDHAA